MIRVLLVDDADELRLLYRRTLEIDGRFEIIGDAADGIEAMEFLDHELPDVIVLDIGMPRMDGLQVLSAMKEKGYGSKVLALSGFDGGVEERAAALGADAYIRKGDAPLTELVSRLIALCPD